MAQYSAFGKRVAKRLIDMEQNQKWLIGQVHDKTGLYFDSSYLSKVMNGMRTSPKVINAICEILEIGREEESDGATGLSGESGTAE